jgi:hypothetical protein
MRLTYINILMRAVLTLIFGAFFYLLIAFSFPVEAPRLTDKQITSATPCQQEQFRIWTTEQKVLYTDDLAYATTICHQKALLALTIVRTATNAHTCVYQTGFP